MDDDEFDDLRERSPEQEAASDETQEDAAAGMPAHGAAEGSEPHQARPGERGRVPQAGL